MAEQEEPGGGMQLVSPPESGAGKKMLLWGGSGLVVVGVVIFVIVLLLPNSEPEEDIDALLDEIPVLEADTTTAFDFETDVYDDDVVMFEYPVGYHMSGLRQYDVPGRVYPAFSYSLHSAPYVIVSPAGGRQVPEISIVSLEQGAVYTSPYADVAWIGETTEEMDVNGVTGTRMTFTAPADAVYVPPYHEVVMVGHFVLTYTGPAELSSAWQLLLETFESQFDFTLFAAPSASLEGGEAE